MRDSDTDSILGTIGMLIFIAAIATPVVMGVSYINKRSEDMDSLKTKIPESHFRGLENMVRVVIPTNDGKTFGLRFVKGLESLTYSGPRMNVDDIQALNSRMINVEKCFNTREDFAGFKAVLAKSIYNDYHKKLLNMVVREGKSLKPPQTLSPEDLVAFCNWSSFDADFQKYNEESNNKETDPDKRVILEKNNIPPEPEQEE